MCDFRCRVISDCGSTTSVAKAESMRDCSGWSSCFSVDRARATTAVSTLLWILEI